MPVRNTTAADVEEPAQKKNGASRGWAGAVSSGETPSSGNNNQKKTSPPQQQQQQQQQQSRSQEARETKPVVTPSTPSTTTTVQTPAPKTSGGKQSWAQLMKTYDFFPFFFVFLPAPYTASVQPTLDPNRLRLPLQNLLQSLQGSLLLQHRLPRAQQRQRQRRLLQDSKLFTRRLLRRRLLQMLVRLLDLLQSP